MEPLGRGQGKLHKVKFNNRWHPMNFVYLKKAFSLKILREVRVKKSRNLRVGVFLFQSR